MYKRKRKEELNRDTTSTALAQVLENQIETEKCECRATKEYIFILPTEKIFSFVFPSRGI